MQIGTSGSWDKRYEMIKSGGQRSRLQKVGKASVLTPLGRVASIAYRRFHPNAKQHKNLLFNCFYSLNYFMYSQTVRSPWPNDVVKSAIEVL